MLSVASLLYHPRVHFPTDGYDNPVCPLKEGLDGFNWLMDLLIPPTQQLWWDYMSTRPEAGRFGLKLEGTGKVCILAIPNPIFQRLLKPLHDWEMSVLKSMRTYGTFDQLRPLRRLRGKKELYSFDLKMATDMFPSVLTGSIFAGIFEDDLGHVWFHMMNQIAFWSPELTGSPSKARVYCFTRGQPLGYLSSWPLFTLTRHMVVWLAAYEVYPGKKFWDYSIFGDDIVIADKRVAEAYMRIMDEMGGVISIQKSLISHNGSCCSYATRCCGFWIIPMSVLGNFVVLEWLGDAEIAEAIAMRQAIHLVLRQGWSMIIIEEDWATLIHKLQASEWDLSVVGPIIMDIWELASCFRSCSFQFVKRSCNAVAHYLAQVARVSAEGGHDASPTVAFLINANISRK
ncbi:UNVERIFIED_CONTAM: putative mitochondrial protein [Sesamum radiatum]|uniref:Mitochondrial protein n=1 Tax=Sesamum radiatum TaxID=300843 RepID=A0AAW2RZC4_SESRA